MLTKEELEILETKVKRFLFGSEVENWYHVNTILRAIAAFKEQPSSIYDGPELPKSQQTSELGFG